MMQLIYEAIVVGISTVIFGNIAAFLVGPFFKVDLPKECKNWNKFYAMEITLFVTGVLFHLTFEYAGLNKWYCKNGFVTN